MNQDRKLVAILYADIQGYTALMQNDELLAMQILDRFEMVLEAEVEQFHGEIVKKYGDGSICVFPSAMSSIECAVSIQEKLHGELQVPLRIGLHLGDVIFKRGDIYGDALNIAARIESIATPGSVLISRSLYEKIKNQRAFQFESLGNLEFKNVLEALEVFAIVKQGIAVPKRNELVGKLEVRKPWTRHLRWVVPALMVLIAGMYLIQKGAIPGIYGLNNSTSDSALSERSIAVLPFEAIGQEGSLIFTDGIHSDILTRLSKLSELNVISRTSVLQYRNQISNLPEIARELGVKWIIIGEVQEAGTQVRVNARLVNGPEDLQVWAEVYRRELTAGNIFDIQAEITEKIATQLQLQLTTEEQQVTRLAPTKDLMAYRSYVEGRALLDQRTESAMRQAMTYFEQAIERDSTYALAWVGLADALTLIVNYGHTTSERMLSKAIDAATRALEIQPNLAEAHATRGLIHSELHQLQEAIRELERAVELQPNYAEAYNWLSWVQYLAGFSESGVINARKAVELNPLSTEAISNLCMAFMVIQKYDVALLEAQKMQELSDFGTARFYEGLALYHLSRFKEADTLLHGLTVPWANAGVLTLQALTHLASGDMSSGNDILLELEATNDQFGVGLVRAAMGESDRAYEIFMEIEAWDSWPTLAIRYLFPELLAAVREHPGYPDIIVKVDRSWGVKR